MFELLSVLRRLVYAPFDTRPSSVKRSAPLDEQEFVISPKMRRLSRPHSDEWYSVSSSDNSRKTSSKKLNSNYPTITVDDDDDIIEIRDLGSKRRLPQHTSTPAENGFKRNGNTTSAYFGSANAPSLGIRRPTTNGVDLFESTANILKRARETMAGALKPKKSSVVDLTFRLDEKLRYKELLEKSSPNVFFSSSDDSLSKYHTPVGKYLSAENFRSRKMVEACKARQQLIDSIDLTESSSKRNKLRKSTATAEAVIKVLDDFDNNDAILVKDSDSDVEILPTPPSPKPDFKVERVNSLKPVVDSCEFSKRQWLEEQNEKLRHNKESKKEKSEELENCTRKLNRINREIEQKRLEELVRTSLTIKDSYIICDVDENAEVELPPLTEEQEATVMKALHARRGQLIVSKFNLNIYTEDITTLAGLTWLNDSVINFYMNLIIERGKSSKFPSVHCFNTFFYPKLIKDGYTSLRRWTKKVDIFSHDLVAVPIHLQMHWCMAIIDFRDKSIRYYDSMGGANRKCLEALHNYLRSEHKDKKGTDYDLSGWQMESVSGDEIPQQMNGSDCGVFSCTFAEFLTRDAKLTFGQEDMPYLRRKMVYEIVSGQLMIS